MKKRSYISIMLLSLFLMLTVISVCQAEKKRYIVKLETGHPSAFGKGKAAFALARNGVITKLPSQSRHIRDLGIINAVVVEAETSEELWVEGVIAVEEDGKVELHLTESVPQIRADQAQALGYTGVGVKVGIIDTGIDYTHPDVVEQYAGGYDIYFDDPDPMDQHFHGTHVAGIVAAVAPDVDLYAIKVFGSTGSTSSSNIIAGIGWAADPNSDGDTSDHLDIVNMSLGASSYPNDSMCLAVTNAKEVGVISFASAGNRYREASVGVPGLCQDAIGVAANTKGDPPVIASFSSQGPALWFTNGVNLNKPDISAPGVSICAALLSTSDRSLCNEIPMRTSASGTSMSSPHAAGVGAILKQAHPEYFTEEMRRALKGSAKPFPYTPLSNDSPYAVDAYGAGEIDAIAALEYEDTDPDGILLHPTAIYLDGNASGRHIIAITYNGPAQEVRVDGYPVDVAEEVSTDFNVTITIPDNLGSGVYQSRLSIGSRDIVIYFLVDRIVPDNPILLLPEDLAIPQIPPLRIKWLFGDNLCIYSARQAWPNSGGSLSVTSIKFSKLPTMNDYCYVSWKWSVNVHSNVPLGSYEIWSEITDVNGNTTRSPNRTLVIGAEIPTEPPEAPTNLTAIVGDSIILNWLDNSTNEEGFKIERDQIEIASIDANQTAYVDAVVVCGESYRYQVRAFSGELFSGYSNSITATMSDCPPPPDEISPILMIISPVNNTIVPRKSSFTVLVDASDNDSGVAFVRMAIKNSLCMDRSAPYSCQFRTTGKPSAPYKVSVYAQDRVGNKSDIRSVTVYSEGN